MNEKPLKFIFGIISAIVISATTYVIVVDDESETDDDVSETGASINISEGQVARLEDGEYEATVNYDSPGGDDDITVAVTLESGVITEVSVINRTSNDVSKNYTDNFEANYEVEVLGQELEQFELATVSGASLTTDAFNDALDEIRNLATALE